IYKSYNMDSFIKNNIPYVNEKLTNQEAANHAAYLLSFERPVWEGHDDDWPKEDDERPTDIITKDRREQIREGTFDWTEIDNIIPKEIGRASCRERVQRGVGSVTQET